MNNSLVTTAPNSQPANFVSAWLRNLLHTSALFSGVFLFITWLAVFHAGRLVEYTEHASVWFPVAGLTFSCLLVLGKRAVLPIMLGAVVITIWQGNHYQLPLSLSELIWAGFLFGLAHIVPYWIGAVLIRRISQKEGHSTPQLIVSFLLIAGFSALIVTALVISSLVFTNQMDLSEVSKTLLPFWVGDMAGVIVLTPLFSGILISLFPNTSMSLREFTDHSQGAIRSSYYKMVLNAFLIVVTMLLAYLSGSFESSFAIFFLAVTHMWIACTENPKFNVISLATSSLLIVLLVDLLGLMEHVMVYQFAINVIAANALFGIAIPQLKAYNRELEYKISTDTLTQVSSRQYLEQQASVDINYSHQHNVDLSLVVFDMDDFKQINDQHGHNAGDRALQEICEAAKQSLRRNDVLARFGGDEFVLLFPELDESAAHQVVERIRRAVRKIQIENTTLSSSFGIAQLRANENFANLFHRADQALYDSKNKGGNTISIAVTPPKHDQKLDCV